MKRAAVKPIYISMGMFAVLVGAFAAGDGNFLSAYNAQTILNAVAILLAVGSARPASS